MKVRADAIELEGPLPGGAAQGASVVVEPMLAGIATQPPGYFERQPGRLRGPLRALGVGVSKDDYTRLPVPSFLVRHPTVGPILIDTGLHPSVATDPRQNLGRLLGSLFELEQGSDVPSRLRSKGLSPKDVRVVILTHLHVDHASAISEFPDATFVLSAPEWKVATESPSLLRGYRTSHYDFAFDYCTVDFDADFIGSYGAFGRTFDVFGDGSVRLVFTPGHTLGHCSVILSLPRRDFVVAADVAYYWRQIEGGPEPYQVPDRHSWRRSLRELNAFRAAYPYALVVPGHDPEFWPKLEARYEE
ncbi:MAG: N-acyl homoserine lactonase family protein [Actinomycetota bacterium]|nr:N-acyl homoserine lactonase family protein [Actinomycetota bacterium]